MQDQEWMALRKKGTSQDGKEPVTQMVKGQGAGRVMRKEALIHIGTFWYSVLVSDLVNGSTQLLPPGNSWIMGDSA